jgi:hypothetical protein
MYEITAWILLVDSLVACNMTVSYGGGCYFIIELHSLTALSTDIQRKHCMCTDEKGRKKEEGTNCTETKKGYIRPFLM